MIRRMFLLVVLIVALAGIDASSPALPSADRLAIDASAQEALLDLAWLTPGPADLDVDGYGLTYGAYQTAASEGVSVYGNAGALTDYDEAFAAGSPRQTYYQLLSLRSDDDPDIVARQLPLVLAEYEDEGAAETGFASVADVFASYDQTRTPPEVGDEAIAFRGEFTSSDGRVYQELRILVRSGRFLADLAIDDYEGDSPAISELSPLADLLVERLENAAEAEGPALGLQVARITGERVTTYYDYYTRRDGDEVPIEGERASQRQTDDELFDEAGTEDSYFYVAEALPDDQDPNLVSAGVDFRRFTDDERAADYLGTAVEDWTAAMGDAYSDIEVVDDAEEFGDGSVTVSYVQDSNFGPLTGYRIWIQIADRVAAVELDGDPAMSLSAAEDMATLQLACLEDEECLEPIATAALTQAEPEANEEDTPTTEADQTPQEEDNETPQAEGDNS